MFCNWQSAPGSGETSRSPKYAFDKPGLAINFFSFSDHRLPDNKFSLKHFTDRQFRLRKGCFVSWVSKMWKLIRKKALLSYSRKSQTKRTSKETSKYHDFVAGMNTCTFGISKSISLICRRYSLFPIYVCPAHGARSGWS